MTSIPAARGARRLAAARAATALEIVLDSGLSC